QRYVQDAVSEMLIRYHGRAIETIDVAVADDDRLVFSADGVKMDLTHDNLAPASETASTVGAGSSDVH
ncbi:MAG: hypothetical protein AAF772_05510, partial [Acidobacteriota bacterium]